RLQSAVERLTLRTARAAIGAVDAAPRVDEGGVVWWRRPARPSGDQTCAGHRRKYRKLPHDHLRLLIRPVAAYCCPTGPEKFIAEPPEVKTCVRTAPEPAGRPSRRPGPC